MCRCISSIWRCFYLHIYLLMDLSMYRSVYVCIYLSGSLCLWLLEGFVFPFFFLSLSLYQPPNFVPVSASVSVCLSVCLSLSLSLPPSVCPLLMNPVSCFLSPLLVFTTFSGAQGLLFSSVQMSLLRGAEVRLHT